METTPVITLEELDARIDARPGWLVLHVGIALHSQHARTSLAFERGCFSRADAAGSEGVQFVRLELSPVDAVHCSIAFGATPFAHLYRDGERVESMPAPVDDTDYEEWLDFAMSFYPE